MNLEQFPELTSRQHWILRFLALWALASLVVFGYALSRPSSKDTATPTRSLAVLLPTVTPTPLPTPTPDPDTVYLDALKHWVADTRAWVDTWTDARDWAAVVAEGEVLDARLADLPVPAGRTNLHGLATETFSACLESTRAFRDGSVAGGRIWMSTCTTGFTLLADKMARER